MSGILLTPYSGAILGPIAKVLGIVLNAIFNIVPNVGVSIILFTFVIYIVLLPLTYQQQKFSKLSAKMNPELKAIQAKYKNRKDQESMAMQNEEMQYVYKKYGVSPTGSCVQLAVQMPILFALYRVIYAVPAYVHKIYECLEKLALNIQSTSDGISVLSGLTVTSKGEYAKYVTNGNFTGENAVNAIIDVLNRASNADWDVIGTIKGLDPAVYESVRTQFEHYNSFLGLNICYSPMNTMKEAFASGKYGMVILALMIPALAALTQWINTLFMPQAGGDDSTSNMMKSMNMTMPLVSATFCLGVPCGLGLYWIAGAVVRSIQQVFINRHIDRMDLDKLIEKNLAKKNIKKPEPGKGGGSITASATRRTSTITSRTKTSHVSEAERDAAMAKFEKYQKNAKEGSLAQKAGLVKKYNEKNKS